MPHNVFISYSHTDRQTAEMVCARLEDRGIGCWIAPRDILPGADWGASIIDGIDNARVMVLVFSSASNQSHQVRREVERAVAKNVTIIPLKVEQVRLGKTLEYFLATTHWLDASSSPLEIHLGRLAEGVEALLAAPRDTTGAIEARKFIPPPLPEPTLEPAPVFVPRPAPAGPPPLPEPVRGPAAPPSATPKSRKTAILVAGAAAAVILILVSIAMQGGGDPEVLGIEFPSAIAANGQNVNGSLRFRAGKANVLGARFTVVSALAFTPFEIRNTAPGKEGQIGFLIHMTTPQRVTLEARAVDAAGKVSRPYRFTFEARAVAPFPVPPAPVRPHR